MEGLGITSLRGRFKGRQQSTSLAVRALPKKEGLRHRKAQPPKYNPPARFPLDSAYSGLIKAKGEPKEG